MNGRTGAFLANGQIRPLSARRNTGLRRLPPALTHPGRHSMLIGMDKQTNIDAWLAPAPADVRDMCRDLLAKVERMRQTQVIYPAQDDILNALAWTAPADVRVVILGQDPYHEPGQAMGLSFSVPSGTKLPPSLRNIYKEMAADLGCLAPISGDLTPWARQGVLLLNTTLTVREHAANSHAKLGWQALTNYVVGRCLELEQPIVFLTWGRHAVGLVEKAREAAAAAGQEALLANKFTLASTHPSPLSANRAGGGLCAFMGSRPFSQANKLLVENSAQPIDWQQAG